MPYRPNPRPTTRSASTHGRRGRRAGLCAVLLTGSVTILLAAGTVGPGAAAVTETAERSGARTTQAPVTNEARVTTAVLDLDHPARNPQVRGKDIPYDTASIIKVDILAVLLLQAQDAGHGLTQQERTQAEAMIERSDNDAANALWRRIGLAPGLEAVNKRLGLSSTVGGAGGKWGLTRTTVTDQIRLLRAVFADGGTTSASEPALTTTSRNYIRTLMTRIAAGQSWGVSAASDSGWALKNGWLQRSTTGLWDINSVGQVTSGTHHYLVAVLSDGNVSMTGGIAAVERAARAAVSSARAAG
ncbi:serine hydrolase [Streptomyces pseudovenezuelae]|uniref:Beta-lactamase class A n=1 Tax=Streptomyces pseudovenezuelae TaxID=67350 RepID=A0ABT6M2P0_9ACTN|nr:serine hydrolase [Streptomyces pseudovenezuelae]MDH6222400.1 beta-lactamase class A [Streptomyces pseudovenezuelae]